MHCQDDGSHSIACEKCNVWQHSACHGIKKEAAEREDFHFVCSDCKRQASEVSKPIPPLRLRGLASSSPKAGDTANASNAKSTTQTLPNGAQNGSPIVARLESVTIPQPSAASTAGATHSTNTRPPSQGRPVSSNGLHRPGSTSVSSNGSIARSPSKPAPPLIGGFGTGGSPQPNFDNPTIYIGGKAHSMNAGRRGSGDVNGQSHGESSAFLSC